MRLIFRQLKEDGWSDLLDIESCVDKSWAIVQDYNARLKNKKRKRGLTKDAVAQLRQELKTAQEENQRIKLCASRIIRVSQAVIAAEERLNESRERLKQEIEDLRDIANS